MKKEELQQEIGKAQESLKDFNKFIHLVSDDDGVRELAELRQTLSRISLLLTINELKELAHPENKALQDGGRETGCLVKIRPCGEEYGNKSYLGFYLGDLALGSSITTAENKIQLNFSGHNPAIFVPSLKKIIYGCESWWGPIRTEKDLAEITDSDIDKIWYVQLWKEMARDAETKKGE